MDEGSSRKRWALGLAVLIAFAVGVWRSGNDDVPAPPAQEAPAIAAPREVERSAAPEASAGEAREPDHRIAERGRLTLQADALPQGRPLTLALDLDDEARGDAPRAVRIGSEDGREIETHAGIATGSGSGVHLELEPRFLKPGRYLIEVSTAEQSHFPVRRYVLIVE